jgi:hypothetical protein
LSETAKRRIVREASIVRKAFTVQDIKRQRSASRLTIYLAKKDGNWLQYDDEDVSQLKKKEVPMDVRNKYCTQELKMEPTYFLSNYFSVDTTPKEKHIHGLVVVPERKYFPPFFSSTYQDVDIHDDICRIHEIPYLSKFMNPYQFPI